MSAELKRGPGRPRKPVQPKPEGLIVPAGVSLVEMPDDLAARNRAYNDWQLRTLAIQVEKRRGRNSASLVAVIGRSFNWVNGYAVFTNDEAARMMGGINPRKAAAALAELVEDGSVFIAKEFRQATGGYPVPERRIFLALPVATSASDQGEDFSPSVPPEGHEQKNNPFMPPVGRERVDAPRGAPGECPPGGTMKRLTFVAGAPSRAPAEPHKGGSVDKDEDDLELVEDVDGRALSAPITVSEAHLLTDPTVGPGPAAEKEYGSLPTNEKGGGGHAGRVTEEDLDRREAEELAAEIAADPFFVEDDDPLPEGWDPEVPIRALAGLWGEVLSDPHRYAEDLIAAYIDLDPDATERVVATTFHIFAQVRPEAMAAMKAAHRVADLDLLAASGRGQEIAAGAFADFTASVRVEHFKREAAKAPAIETVSAEEATND